MATATRRADASLVLLLVNVLEVSTLQARLGFAVSAVLLQQLSDRFSQTVATRGTVIRLGDGVFGIIIDAVRNRGHAVLAGEKLLRVADEVFAAAELSIKPQLCIGIALLPLHTIDPPVLLRYAQLAVAAASREFLRLQVYNEAVVACVVKSWDLSDAFAKALETGELSVYYQPKIRTADCRPAGVEALLRWLRDGLPVSTPDVFVPLAEEAGLIHNTTWYVLSNALRCAAECGGLQVAVNITPRMLHHREFMDMVDTAIATWGVGDNVLTLEVTEGALMVDFEQASKRLTKLRDSGVRISIDDFGTGYSSLSYFKKIPADELKIDKSFVMRMLQDSADHRLVETILKLAQQFKLATVAEGVEDRATYDALVAMGCDYAQGFLFSPAIDGLKLKEWLSANPKTDCFLNNAT